MSSCYEDNHSLYFESGILTRNQIMASITFLVSQMRKSFLSLMKDTFTMKVTLVSKKNNSGSFCYVWISDPAIYHFLTGNNPDGSERVEKFPDPDWVSPKKSKDEEMTSLLAQYESKKKTFEKDKSFRKKQMKMDLQKFLSKVTDDDDWGTGSWGLSIENAGNIDWTEEEDSEESIRRNYDLENKNEKTKIESWFSELKEDLIEKHTCPHLLKKLERLYDSPIIKYTSKQIEILRNYKQNLMDDSSYDSEVDDDDIEEEFELNIEAAKTILYEGTTKNNLFTSIKIPKWVNENYLRKIFSKYSTSMDPKFPLFHFFEIPNRKKNAPKIKCVKVIFAPETWYDATFALFHSRKIVIKDRNNCLITLYFNPPR